MQHPAIDSDLMKNFCMPLDMAVLLTPIPAIITANNRIRFVWSFRPSHNGS
jgi:hypothetical protein